LRLAEEEEKKGESESQPLNIDAKFDHFRRKRAYQKGVPLTIEREYTTVNNRRVLK